jgi:hypothetical protein
MAITAKGEQEKNSRVDKAMGAMKKPEKQAGTLRHISVRPAENGYTVGVDRDMPVKTQSISQGKDQPSSTYEPPKDHVFSGKNAKQDVLDHISQHLD